MTFRTILCLLLCLSSFTLALSSSKAFADFSGPVVSVLDGDTLEVLHNNHAERIRLSGIDCPEKGQAYGKKAKQALMMKAPCLTVFIEASPITGGRNSPMQTHHSCSPKSNPYLPFSPVVGSEGSSTPGGGPGNT